MRILINVPGGERYCRQYLFPIVNYRKNSQYAVVHRHRPDSLQGVCGLAQCPDSHFSFPGPQRMDSATILTPLAPF